MKLQDLLSKTYENDLNGFVNVLSNCENLENMNISGIVSRIFGSDKIDHIRFLDSLFTRVPEERQLGEALKALPLCSTSDTLQIYEYLEHLIKKLIVLEYSSNYRERMSHTIEEIFYQSFNQDTFDNDEIIIRTFSLYKDFFGNYNSSNLIENNSDLYFGCYLNDFRRLSSLIVGNRSELDLQRKRNLALRISIIKENIESTLIILQDFSFDMDVVEILFEKKNETSKKALAFLLKKYDLVVDDSVLALPFEDFRVKIEELLEKGYSPLYSTHTLIESQKKLTGDISIRAMDLGVSLDVHADNAQLIKDSTAFHNKIIDYLKENKIDVNIEACRAEILGILIDGIVADVSLPSYTRHFFETNRAQLMAFDSQFHKDAIPLCYHAKDDNQYLVAFRGFITHNPTTEYESLLCRPPEELKNKAVYNITETGIGAPTLQNAHEEVMNRLCSLFTYLKSKGEKDWSMLVYRLFESQKAHNGLHGGIDSPSCFPGYLGRIYFACPHDEVKQDPSVILKINQKIEAIVLEAFSSYIEGRNTDTICDAFNAISGICYPADSEDDFALRKRIALGEEIAGLSLSGEGFIFDEKYFQVRMELFKIAFGAEVFASLQKTYKDEVWLEFANKILTDCLGTDANIDDELKELYNLYIQSQILNMAGEKVLPKMFFKAKKRLGISDDAEYKLPNQYFEKSLSEFLAESAKYNSNISFLANDLDSFTPSQKVTYNIYKKQWLMKCLQDKILKENNIPAGEELDLVTRNRLESVLDNMRQRYMDTAEIHTVDDFGKIFEELSSGLSLDIQKTLPGSSIMPLTILYHQRLLNVSEPQTNPPSSAYPIQSKGKPLI